MPFLSTKTLVYFVQNNSLFTDLIFSGSVSRKFNEMVDLVSFSIGKATISRCAVIYYVAT